MPLARVPAPARGTRSTRGTGAVSSALHGRKSIGSAQRTVWCSFLQEREGKQAQIKGAGGRLNSCQRRGTASQLFPTAPWAAPRLPSARSVRAGKRRSFIFALRLFRARLEEENGCGLCWELGRSRPRLSSRISPLRSASPARAAFTYFDVTSQFLAV